MRVSVVICTYNRADALRTTLDALRYQTFTDFEVVVVNGPSTDRTVDVLEEWASTIKTAHNPEPNLSISRNLGIRAAAGDLVAFIDDDAIPEFDWLADIVAAFEADDVGEVAGVGGLVFDHTGTRFQFRFAASSRLGEPKLSDTTPFDDLSIPGGFWFPYLQGTNAVFRRDVLCQVGGFDETFDYYLDETDLCARIVDAGYTLRQLDDAHVHHKFLSSSVRNDNRIFTRWYPVIKNLTYFGYRHAAVELGTEAVLDKARAELDFRVRESRMHERFGELPVGTADRVRVDGARAINDGRRLAEAAGDGALPAMFVHATSFLPFEVKPRCAPRVLVLVTSAYGGRLTGGISRFITDVAPRLAERGHEIRVVTTSPDHSRVDFEDGIWVHRIDPMFGGALPGTSATIDNFASGAATEVGRIATFRRVDVVYGPAWDMEVLPVIRTTALPVVVLLATPVAVTNHLDGEQPYHPDPYAALLLELEHETFQTADLLHADSDCVVGTIAERYPRPLDPARVEVAHLGTEDRPMHPGPARADGAMSVVFVGRLEPRKGIDTLLCAIELLAPDRPTWHFVIVGAENPGEGEFRRPWLDRHGDAEWSQRVHFTGQLDDVELERVASAAQIAVVPSRYESFGLTVVEAMRRGVPLVAAAAGAIPELVEDGREALLVPPHDPRALAEAIARLADDATLRAELAERARARYVREFTMESATERLERALGRVRLVACDGLSAGSGGTIDVPAHGADVLRLVVRTPSGAVAHIDGARVDIEATEPGRVRRIDVVPSNEVVCCSVDRGRLEVVAAIVVAGATP